MWGALAESLSREPNGRSSMTAEPLRSEHHGPTLVVHLGPEYDSLDESSLDRVQDFLLACTDVKDVRNMVVDLSHTKFFGSAFIEVLFRAYNRIKRKAGKFALSGLQAHPKEVILISKLNTIWQLYATAAEAVQALNATKIETSDGPGVPIDSDSG